MSVKLTKNELRSQQVRLVQFERYLPTLQLKKAMLQMEVSAVNLEIESLKQEVKKAFSQVEGFAPFLVEKVEVHLSRYAEVLHVKKRYENVAGVETPIFDRVVFRPPSYFLFDTPVWTEKATELLQELVVFKERLSIAQEKKRALEKELKDVSIRVNLFEKVLIPRAEQNIKKIRIFLGDQQLASVAQAKVAKQKILKKKELV